MKVGVDQSFFHDLHRDEGRIGSRIERKGHADDSYAGLYFVGAMGANLVKIGWVRRTDRIDRRLDRIVTDCPYPVILLHTFRPIDMKGEARVHTHFRRQHFHGEWFKWEGELQEFLAMADADHARASEKLLKIARLTI